MGEGILRLGEHEGGKRSGSNGVTACAREGVGGEEGEGCLRVNRGVEDYGGGAGGQRNQVLHVSL